METGKKEVICALLDKLLLEMLNLIEQEVQCKVNIEKRTNEGKLLLAKARYIQGGQSVCIAQIPTENSTDFRALSTVKEESSQNLIKKKLSLEVAKIDKDVGLVDPIRWFGVLVPRSLQLAKEKFVKSVELVVECTNIQRELQSVLCYITKLTHIKKSM